MIKVSSKLCDAQVLNINAPEMFYLFLSYGLVKALYDCTNVHKQISMIVIVYIPFSDFVDRLWL